VAEVLFALFLQSLFEFGPFCRFTLGFPGCDILAFVVIDVPSNFKIEIGLSSC
jgi:hypothetical protein